MVGPTGTELRSNLTPTEVDEFTKSSNEKVLFILNRFSGLALYTHQFVPTEQDPQILSGFISAMMNFMGEVSGLDESKWKTEFGSDSVLLVDSGEWAVGVLTVSRETSEGRSKLRRIVREFEDSFQSLRETDAVEPKVFKDFDHYVRRVFLGDRLSGHTIIQKHEGWAKNAPKYELPSTSFILANLMHSSRSGQSLNRIAEEQEIELSTVIDLVSQAVWKNNLSVIYAPSDRDILSLSSGSASHLFDKNNPLEVSRHTMRLLASLDGRKPFLMHLQNLKLKDDSFVRIEVADLINKGMVQRISLERRLVLVNECILTGIISNCSRLVGDSVATSFLNTAIDQCVADNPWAARVTQLGMNPIRVLLTEDMTPEDLDSICDAIETLGTRIAQQLSETIGFEAVSEVLSYVKKQCHKRWEAYLDDVFV